jgi:hypothetical protein
MSPKAAILRLTTLAALAAPGPGVLAAQESGKPETTKPGAALPASSPGEPAAPKTPASEEQRLVAVGEALAAANAELESLREQHAQLKLQMEALGIAAVKGDERSLQQRLLKAAADLSGSEAARKEQSERLNRLAEAAAAFMARPGEPALKAALEDAIKAATGARQTAAADAVSLESARVVSWKADLGLAVVNAGRDSGLRMGAPMHIYRADRSIATGLVVDVRDRIAGILLTGPTAAAIRVGDSVKPDLTTTLPSQK